MKHRAACSFLILCAKFGGSILWPSGENELWTQQPCFLNNKAKNAQAAETAQTAKPPGLKGLMKCKYSSCGGHHLVQYSTYMYIPLYKVPGLVGDGHLRGEDEGFPPVHHFAVGLLGVFRAERGVTCTSSRQTMTAWSRLELNPAQGHTQPLNLILPKPDSMTGFFSVAWNCSDCTWTEKLFTLIPWFDNHNKLPYFIHWQSCLQWHCLGVKTCMYKTKDNTHKSKSIHLLSQHWWLIICYYCNLFFNTSFMCHATVIVLFKSSFTFDRKKQVSVLVLHLIFHCLTVV